MLTIGICDPDPATRDQLKGIATRARECSVVEIEGAERLSQSNRLLSCDLLLVGVAGPADCEAVRKAASEAPFLNWMAILPYTNPQLAKQALRSGCGTVITAPLDHAVLTAWLDRKLTLPTQGVTHLGKPLARGSVVGVWSWLGGVGKTVIAGNLAAGLAESAGRPICLAEATEGPSRIASLMGATSSLTLRDLADLEQPLTMAALRRVVAPTSYQVGLITAPPTIDGVNALGPSEWMSRAGSKLRECPITTILDLPSGWSDLTRRALAECTSLVLVTPPDAISLEITADAWTSIRQQIPTNPTVYVAMNAIQDDRRWGGDAIKQRFHAEAVVTFPHDSKTLDETWKRSAPLLKRDRGSRWRHSRDELVKIISTELLES